MAQWLAHSNQKLYQTRLLLDALELAETSESTTLSLISALQESVLFQLKLSYQSYLHEVAEIAQCREDFHSLNQLFDLVTIATGEMTELKQLEMDSYSWLSQMLVAFQQCSEKEPVIKKSPVADSMIQLFDTSAVSLPLRDWFYALTNIIDLQRNNRQES